MNYPSNIQISKVTQMNSFQIALAAFTVFAVAAALVEAIVLSRRNPGTYDWRGYWASLGVALGRRLTDLLPLALVMPGGQWLYEHRLIDADINTWWGVLLLFFGLEFFYYWYHRLSHEVRWFWATHAVHHSPNTMSLATAYRLGWTGKITGQLLFFLPLCAIGYTPELVVFAYGVNLLYQFWIHTEWIPRLGFLEGIFNTPSSHRVHHASNLEYLDANYGGVLVIFDRLFGTYIPERDDVPCRYGWVHPLQSNNVFVIALSPWAALLRDVAGAHSLVEALGYLIKPPGWVPVGEGSTTAEMRRRAGIEAGGKSVAAQGRNAGLNPAGAVAAEARR